MRSWSTYGEYKTRGNPPSVSTLLLLVVIAVASVYITDKTLDRIPRGEATYVCKDDRAFDGTVKNTNCGYEQSYGLPFKRTTSFEASANRVSPDSLNARSVGKHSLNEWVLVAAVAGPYLLVKHLYLTNELEKSRNALR